MGRHFHILYALCRISNNVDSVPRILFAFKISQKFGLTRFDTSEINNCVP